MKRLLALALLLCSVVAHAQSCGTSVSPPFIINGATAPKVRVDLCDSTSPGDLLSGLTASSSGLAISCISGPSATWTDYTQAGSTIEGISAIGTYAAPTATKVRFAEIESEGVYELQFDTDLFDDANSIEVTCKVSGATNLTTRVFSVYQGLTTDADLAAAFRDIDNTSPAAGSLGENIADVLSLSATIASDAGNIDTIEGTDATDVLDAQLAAYDAVVPADLPTNFADLSITMTTGQVAVGSVASGAIDDAAVDDDALGTDLTTLATGAQVLGVSTQIFLGTADSGDSDTMVDAELTSTFDNDEDIAGAYVVREDGQRCFIDSFTQATGTVEFNTCTYTGAWATQTYKIYPAGTQ